MRAPNRWEIRFLFMVLFLSAKPLFADTAANVVFIWGSAVAISVSGEKRELAKGASIEAGDTIISEDARLQLRFTDGGFVSLAPHSEFRINAYSYGGAPDGSERIAMELIKGGLRTISGLIGKAIKESYEMKTSIATIGIRGTEYTIVYGDSVSGSVSEGAIAVCNAGGCLDVLHGQSYHVADLNTKPVLISKAALLPPPPPSQGDSKQAAKTNIARLPNKVKSSDKDTKSTVVGEGGRRKDDRNVLEEGTRVAQKKTVSDAGIHANNVYLTFDSSLFKTTLVGLNPDKKTLQLEMSTFPNDLQDTDSGDRKFDKERSVNPPKQLDVTLERR